MKLIDDLFITTTINFRARGLKLNSNMIDSEIVRLTALTYNVISVGRSHRLSPSRAGTGYRVTVIVTCQWRNQGGGLRV
jgi:hypothetical protein